MSSAVSSLIFLPCVAGLFVALVDELFVRHLNFQVHLRLVLIVNQIVGLITAVRRETRRFSKQLALELILRNSLDDVVDVDWIVCGHVGIQEHRLLFGDDLTVGTVKHRAVVVVLREMIRQQRRR